ncbi:MAG: hypothetical protein ACI9DG_001766 [Oleispira sp.]|jgi:hypothetical protein
MSSVSINYLMTNDRCGGIFASQIIRLIGNTYSQINAFLYLWGTISYQSDPKIG